MTAKEEAAAQAVETKREMDRLREQDPEGYKASEKRLADAEAVAEAAKEGKGGLPAPVLKKPTTPSTETDSPGQPAAEQKPGKFDAFHAYMSERMAGAGFSKGGFDRKSGWVATSGIDKGKTQDEINLIGRRAFAKLSPGQRAKYQGLAEGKDIATRAQPGDLVARTGGREPTVGSATFGGLDEGAAYRERGGGRQMTALEKSEEAGAKKLLQPDPGDTTAMQDRGFEAAPLADRPSFREDIVPRANLSAERMAQFEGKKPTLYSGGAATQKAKAQIEKEKRAAAAKAAEDYRLGGRGAEKITDKQLGIGGI